ncbi:MAG: phosphate ABC transporter permease PstA [Actinomycetota bacterium]
MTIVADETDELEIVESVDESASASLASLASTDAGPDGPVATVLPRRPTGPAPVPRPIAKVSRRDVFMAVGAAVSAICTALLLFGRLAPLTGRLGFVVVAFVLYVLIYAFLASLDGNRPYVIDRIMTVLLAGAAVVAGVALTSVILFTLWRGREALLKPNLYTEDMSLAGPLDPLDVGGISHAIVGTLIIMSIALVLTVPLAIVCAVYLNETGGKLTELVRSVVTAMTALPSIIAGLFIFAFWVLVLGYPRSGLAAALAISLMMLPIIIRSADVVLRLVPGNLREASAALGAPHWRTVWFVVLPTARSGLATSVILGVARGVGETAPVLLVSGIGTSMNVNPTENPMMSLPLATFEFVRSPQPTLITRGFATAAVLMVLVLLLFTIARILGGRPAGVLSKGQRRRAEAKSLKDLERIEARHAAQPSAVVATAPAVAPPAPPIPEDR